MYLPMLRRPVAARRRGMPGIAMLGKHFFRRFWQAASADYGTATLGEDTVGESLCRNATAIHGRGEQSHINALARAPSTSLVGGELVGRRPAVALRHRFVFVRIGRDDHSAA